MKRYNFKIVLLILVTACNTGNSNSDKTVSSKSVTLLPFYREASFSPHWINPKNLDSLASFHSIPDFSLVNQYGDTISQKQLKGKVYVADFFFTTCPGICPRMTKNMLLLQEKFKGNEDVALLSHSVMPSVDTVEQLLRYAEQKGITWKNWHLLTGDKKLIYSLGRKAYFVEEDLGNQRSDEDFLHTENFVLVDKNRHIRGIYNGLNKTSIRYLILDIVSLLEE